MSTPPWSLGKSTVRTRPRPRDGGRRPRRRRPRCSWPGARPRSTPRSAMGVVGSAPRMITGAALPRGAGSGPRRAGGRAARRLARSTLTMSMGTDMGARGCEGDGHHGGPAPPEEGITLAHRVSLQVAPRPRKHKLTILRAPAQEPRPPPRRPRRRCGGARGVRGPRPPPHCGAGLRQRCPRPPRARQGAEGRAAAGARRPSASEPRSTRPRRGAPGAARAPTRWARRGRIATGAGPSPVGCSAGRAGARHALGPTRAARAAGHVRRTCAAGAADRRAAPGARATAPRPLLYAGLEPAAPRGPRPRRTR
jgi:hypothetical protein